jgi:hypothetical protein
VRGNLPEKSRQVQLLPPLFFNMVRPSPETGPVRLASTIAPVCIAVDNEQSPGSIKNTKIGPTYFNFYPCGIVRAA